MIRLNGLNSFSNFHFPKSFFPSSSGLFGLIVIITFHNVSALSPGPGIDPVFCFFLLLCYVQLTSSLFMNQNKVFWPRLGDLFISKKSQRSLHSHYYHYFIPWRFFTLALVVFP